MPYLHRTQQLPCTMDQAWEFFSSPRNLDKLTPKSVGFQITRVTSEEMYAGQIITYRIKILPLIWVNWITEITHVRDQDQQQKSFIDDQRDGPYKVWNHSHHFEANDQGVLMTDDVTYSLPFGPIGKLAHILFVKKQLKHIFDERHRLCAEHFQTNN